MNSLSEMSELQLLQEIKKVNVQQAELNQYQQALNLEIKKRVDVADGAQPVPRKQDSPEQTVFINDVVERISRLEKESAERTGSQEQQQADNK